MRGCLVKGRGRKVKVKDEEWLMMLVFFKVEFVDFKDEVMLLIERDMCEDIFVIEFVFVFWCMGGVKF